MLVLVVAVVSLALVFCVAFGIGSGRFVEAGAKKVGAKKAGAKKAGAKKVPSKQTTHLSLRISLAAEHSYLSLYFLSFARVI